ncbi:hypothetical protein Poli38472_013148 [Pythium oligandrum]|uniref:Kazal-like domain-containing protein n=1 Tax=Pythium oligandrum TaxID=41045 RepID=A0A8K1C333_PYTOL|nr:hypothetical protein Poli38472_013148 [Pythium oligandrum]|eukprot:TMW55257.1 hypothetical protein Poli38472_013148 [Pythium oligandrum]
MQVVSILRALAVFAVLDSVSALRGCNMRCTNEMKPVCGSNGFTYDNECHLKLAKCADPDSTLSVVSSGECPTKDQVTATPKGDGCEVLCMDSFNPVCGSDGVTYSNECQLKQANCGKNLKSAITIASTGECATDADASDDNDAEMTIGPAPEPEPVTSDAEVGSDSDCEVSCLSSYQPVCGSDGVTYSNSCELKRANCKSNSRSVGITQVATGECAEAAGSAAAGSETPEPAAGCSKICPSSYSPVCGTNGVTYANKCKFEVAKCTIRIATLAIKSEGECTAASSDDGDDDDDVSDDSGSAEEPVSGGCSRNCSREFKPVCGSDGVTYTNECHFEVARCTKRIAMMSYKDGSCDERRRALRF